MNNLKQFKIIIGILMLIPLISCSNSNPENASAAVKGTSSETEAKAGTIPVKSGGATDTELEKAKKEGKAVFLVITGTGATNLNNAITIAKEANGKVKKSVVVQMNRDEIANSGLVVKFGIGAVTLPFILVISPLGVPVAGVPLNQATSDLLVKSVPSPKQDLVLSALSEKKPVFVIVSKKTLTDKATVVANCKTASAKAASKPAIVEIDFDDAAEKDFLTQIGVSSPVNNKSVTVVINVSSQITETFTDTPTVENLVTAVTKVIKTGGCCPGKKKCG